MCAVVTVEYREMADDARNQAPGSVRVDSWLWAARFFKSRTLATRACDGGKVDVNARGAKAHKPIKAGDIIEFSTGDWRRKVRVLRLSAKRGAASAARLLYDDLSPPPPADRGIFSRPPSRPKGTGRPTKRERREIERYRGH
jgi:ribosome-associated heat shock protein Hsp15